jgi:hypothetical protein
MQQSIARWLIEYDPEATRRCYAQLTVGSGCDCNQCRNFQQVGASAFPADFLSLADSLGLDVTKPAELCHYCREPSGLYLTGGWYHIIGAIKAGEDVMQKSSGTGAFRFEQLVAGFEFGFSAHLALVREPFAGHPLVQLEFLTRVPWFLAEPEPPSCSP